MGAIFEKLFCIFGAPLSFSTNVFFTPFKDLRSARFKELFLVMYETSSFSIDSSNILFKRIWPLIGKKYTNCTIFILILMDFILENYLYEWVCVVYYYNKFLKKIHTGLLYLKIHRRGSKWRIQDFEN